MWGSLVDSEKEFIVHPDMIETLRKYREGNKNAFKEMFKERAKLTDEGKKFWNDTHDNEMRQTADERSRNPMFRWPFRRKKKP